MIKYGKLFIAKINIAKNNADYRTVQFDDLSSIMSKPQDIIMPTDV